MPGQQAQRGGTREGAPRREIQTRGVEGGQEANISTRRLSARECGLEGCGDSLASESQETAGVQRPARDAHACVSCTPKPGCRRQAALPGPTARGTTVSWGPSRRGTVGALEQPADSVIQAAHGGGHPSPLASDLGRR